MAQQILRTLDRILVKLALPQMELSYNGGGTPLNHPYFTRIVHDLNHPAGYPMAMETSKWPQPHLVDPLSLSDAGWVCEADGALLGSSTQLHWTSRDTNLNPSQNSQIWIHTNFPWETVVLLLSICCQTPLSGSLSSLGTSFLLGIPPFTGKYL